jgi:hypothetical protein
LDIDYHWDGDLDSKQTELVDLLRSRLVPEVKRRFEYDGTVSKATGPEADSPFVKTVTVAFYRIGGPGDRIELPVEVTSIPCLDAPVVRTAAGTVYLTASDADMIESKILALLDRVFVEERDILDLFLFQDNFIGDSAQRLRTKLSRRHILPASVTERYARLLKNRAVHVRAIDQIIEDQIDAAVAANLKTSGGGAMVFGAVAALLLEKLKLVDEIRS